MGHFLNVLQSYPFQVVGIVFGHEEAHKVGTGVQFESDGPVDVRSWQIHQLLQGLRQLGSALVRRLEERHQRDVGRKVVGSVPAAHLPRFSPEALQLLEERSRRTRVQDVLPRRALVQRRIVDVCQQPVGGQLHATVSGGGQRLLAAKMSIVMKSSMYNTFNGVTWISGDIVINTSTVYK